jgi:hypothetical protein
LRRIRWLPDLATLLFTIGWSPAELARRLGVNDRTVRRWMAPQDRAGYDAPPAVLAWLGDVAAWIEAHPAPRRGSIVAPSAPDACPFPAVRARGYCCGQTPCVSLNSQWGPGQMDRQSPDDTRAPAPWPHDTFPPGAEHANSAVGDEGRIEVTPDMIEAGETVLREEFVEGRLSSYEREELVRAIYVAMYCISRRKAHGHPHRSHARSARKHGA